MGDVLYVDDIAADARSLVAVGEVGRSEFDLDYVVWTSRDGFNWSAVQIAPEGTTFKPTRFLAIPERLRTDRSGVLHQCPGWRPKHAAHFNRRRDMDRTARRSR